MKFNVNQKDLQEALSYCQGVIEKRSTLPILSNVLLDVGNSKLNWKNGFFRKDIGWRVIKRNANY